MSQLRFSARLGREIRSGDGAALGIPTGRLALDALAAGERDGAHAYVDLLAGETERVYAIFSTWLPELLAFCERELPAFEADRARLAAALGCEPPLLTRAEGAAELLEAAHAAVEEGDADALEAHLAELTERLRIPHDQQVEWCWALLTLVRDELGESRLEEAMRATQEGWVAPRYAALGEMSPQEIFELTIEGMRGHLGGEQRNGAVRVREDDDAWVMEFDPCGTGGRAMRGDPERGRPPAAERRELFGTTREAHPWSWGREGVCIYCAHCALVNEILPIEHLGAPMRVTEHPATPDEPCRWTIYKRRDAIPDEAYRRVGKEPPSQSVIQSYNSAI